MEETKQTTGKELQEKIDPNVLQRLRELTGESNTDQNQSQIDIQKIRIDYRADIDLNGTPNKNYGGFSIVDVEQDESKSYTRTYDDLGKNLNCVILKKRFIAKNFDDKTKTTLFYTNEFDSWVHPIDVSSQGKIVGTDSYKNLKNEFKLKPYLLLYVLYNKEIYRLQLSGRALFIFGDYEKLFFNKETSFCLYETEVTTKKERKSPESPPYFLPIFKEIGKVKDQKQVLEKMKELDEFLTAYEKYKENKHKEELPGEIKKPEEVKPVIKQESKEEIAQEALKIFG